MDELERDVRRLLRSEAWTLDSDAVSLDTVHAAIGRRRSRRAALVAAICAVAFSSGIAIGATALRDDDGAPARLGEPTPTPSVPEDIVPWLEPEPPSAPACRGTDLRPSGVDSGAAAGSYLLTVRVRNAGRSACLLAGLPTLTARAEGDARRSVRYKDDRSDDPSVEERPAVLSPGQTAQVRLTSSTECQGFTATYRDLAVEAAGARFPITDELMSCGLLLKGWFTSRTPLTDAQEDLRVEVEGMPQRAPTGAVVEYAVNLRNERATEVPLDPCPVFEQAIGTSRLVAQLNCAGAPGAVPARGLVRFAMRLDLGDQPAGVVPWTWSLLGSATTPYAGGTLTLATQVSPAPTGGTTARECGAGDLLFVKHGQDGASGKVYYWVIVRNVSPSSCVLDGAPGIAMKPGSATDRVRHVPGLWVPPAGPVSVAPGGLANMAFATQTVPDLCDAGRRSTFAAIRLVLHDGSEVPTDLDLTSECPLEYSDWYLPPG